MYNVQSDTFYWFHSIELESSTAGVTSAKFTKQQLVDESVS